MADPTFPRGEAPTYYLAKFLPKTAWKWKKLDRGVLSASSWIHHCSGNIPLTSLKLKPTHHFTFYHYHVWKCQIDKQIRYVIDNKRLFCTCPTMQNTKDGLFTSLNLCMRSCTVGRLFCDSCFWKIKCYMSDVMHWRDLQHNIIKHCKY